MVVAGLAALVLGAAGGRDGAAAWDRGRGGFHHGFHGPRVFVGPRFYFGPRFSPYYYPYYGPYYAYPSYPYDYDYVAPPVVVTPPAAEVTPPPAQYWYYCQDPAGYYPTVAQCPGGWIQVPPRSAQ